MVWSLDQQHQHYLGTVYKCKLAGAPPHTFWIGNWGWVVAVVLTTVFVSTPCDSDAHWSLRTIGLDDTQFKEFFLFYFIVKKKLKFYNCLVNQENSELLDSITETREINVINCVKKLVQWEIPERYICHFQHSWFF